MSGGLVFDKVGVGRVMRKWAGGKNYIRIHPRAGAAEVENKSQRQIRSFVLKPPHCVYMYIDGGGKAGSAVVLGACRFSFCNQPVLY